jgi:L-amino acid N-acyltransferase YncA
MIRDATSDDWPAIWPICAEIIRAADTFTYDPATREHAARAMRMVGDPGRTTVAVDDDGAVAGTANMYANRAGPGDHVASGSYMVAAGSRGRGVGRALVEDSLSWARGAGFRAMQFNAVAASNTAAVKLYERLGFATVGRVPAAFRHPEQGEVALLVMHRPL